MAVAPSFKDFPIIGEIFIKNGRKYVKVKNPTTGKVREVRWYTDTELAKLTKKKASESVTPDGRKRFKGLKHARGFDNGPILIIRGLKSVADEKWCKQSCARFAVGMGWYIISTDTFPDDAPDHFKYLLLSWDEFRDGDDTEEGSLMKTPEQIAAIIDAKIKRKEFINMKVGKKV